MMTLDEARRVVCEWMEPNPISRTSSRDSENGWWRLVGINRKTGTWIVNPFSGAWSLDRLRLVEKRLTDEQSDRYEEAISGMVINRYGTYDYTAKPQAWTLSRFLLHADADSKKTLALAQVLKAIQKARERK